jgi:hypothetical protein
LHGRSVSRRFDDLSKGAADKVLKRELREKISRR